MEAKIAVLLGIIGMILQFAIRQRKSQNDVVYIVWAAALCSGVYVLTHWPFQGVAWNVGVVDWLVWLGEFPNGAVMTVLAGTGLVSVAANAVVTMTKVNSSNPMIPVTDSK